MGIGSASFNSYSLNALARPWVSHAAVADVSVAVTVAPVGTIIKGADATIPATLGCEAGPERWRLATSDIRPDAGVSIVIGPVQTHGAASTIDVGLVSTASIVALAVADISLSVSIEVTTADKLGEAETSCGVSVSAEATKIQPATGVIGCESDVVISSSLFLATRYADIDCTLGVSVLVEPSIKLSGETFFTHFSCADVSPALTVADTAGWFIAQEQVISAGISFECPNTVRRAVNLDLPITSQVDAVATAWPHPLVGFISTEVSIVADAHSISRPSVEIDIAPDVSLTPRLYLSGDSDVDATITSTATCKLIRGGVAEIGCEASVVDGVVQYIRGGVANINPGLTVLASSELGVQGEVEALLECDFFSRGVLALQADEEISVLFVMAASATSQRGAGANVNLSFLVEAEGFSNVEVSAPSKRTIVVDYEAREIKVSSESRVIEVY